MGAGPELACPGTNINTYSQEKGIIIKNVSSWLDCSDLCMEREDCKYWTWARETAGIYAKNCVTMAGFKFSGTDSNVMSGKRDCRGMLCSYVLHPVFG